LHWLIDGYNVIHRAAHIGAGGADEREALLNALANAAQRSARDRFTVVFDGRRGGSRMRAGGGVAVVYSSGQETADDVLKRLAGAGTTVVSDDREVSEAAARSGARAMSVAAFLARLRGERRR